MPAGGQNDTRYALFPVARRLAVQTGGGPVRLYDTLDHVVSGVQQQQGARPGPPAFSSQHGTFIVDSLPLANASDPAAAPAAPSVPVPVPVPDPAPAAAAAAAPTVEAPAAGADPEVILCAAVTCAGPCRARTRVSRESKIG